MLAPIPGTIIARKYRVERTLGAGGMGLVVAAMHLELEQLVAIKILLPNVAQDALLVARFAREGKLAARIASDHVARIIDVGQAEDGTPFIVMEYLDGEDLMAVVRARGALPVQESVEYVLHACDAVAVAHAIGIIHRDLKPANLFVTQQRDGAPLVKVLDFGISKVMGGLDEGLTSTGLIGSPVYMAPEQMTSARDVDARADIWSLGAILFRLLGGAPPYDADNVVRLARIVATQAPRSLLDLAPDVPPELEAVVLRCLTRDPDGRFASVRDLAVALRPFAPARCGPLVDRIAGTFGAARERAPLRSSLDSVPSQPSSLESLDQRGETLSSHSTESLLPPTPTSNRSAWMLAAVIALLIGVGAGAAFYARRSVASAFSPPVAASGGSGAIGSAVTGASASASAGETRPSETAVVSPVAPTATTTTASSGGAPVRRPAPRPRGVAGERHGDAGADSWGWNR